MTTFTDPRNLDFHIREVARAMRPALYPARGKIIDTKEKRLKMFERKNLEKTIKDIMIAQCSLGYRMLLPVPRVLTERQRLAARTSFQNNKPIHEIVADVLDVFPFVELQ